MHTWIALLRGINVGGRNLLPMKELVRDLESLNLHNVKTYIQSGNAVFQSSRTGSATLANNIARQIEKRHGFQPHVLILSANDLQLAMDANPFPDAEADPKSLHCFFLSSLPTTPDIGSMTKVKSSSERFQLIDHTFYLHAPDGIGRSKLAANAEKFLGVTTTARNWRTVRKLSEMANNA